MPSFSAQNISNAVMSFAKLEHHPGRLLESISAAALSRLNTFTPQVCSALVAAWPVSMNLMWDICVVEMWRGTAV